MKKLRRTPCFIPPSGKKITFLIKMFYLDGIVESSWFLDNKRTKGKCKSKRFLLGQIVNIAGDVTLVALDFVK